MSSSPHTPWSSPGQMVVHGKRAGSRAHTGPSPRAVHNVLICRARRCTGKQRVSGEGEGVFQVLTVASSVTVGGVLGVLRAVTGASGCSGGRERERRERGLSLKMQL